MSLESRQRNKLAGRSIFRDALDAMFGLIEMLDEMRDDEYVLDVSLGEFAGKPHTDEGFYASISFGRTLGNTKSGREGPNDRRERGVALIRAEYEIYLARELRERQEAVTQEVINAEPEPARDY